MLCRIEPQARVDDAQLKLALGSEEAAAQGDVSAQINLGVLCANGTGAPQNSVMAYMWISLSTAQGDTTGYKYLNELAKAMTSQEITQAKSLVAKWQPNSSLSAKK